MGWAGRTRRSATYDPAWECPCGPDRLAAEMKVAPVNDGPVTSRLGTEKLKGGKG